MLRVYVTAFAPAAARDTADGLVAPFLTSPNDPGVHTFGVPLVPLAGPVDAVPTAYGLCSAVPDDSGLYAALPSLSAGLPGATYAVVSPWRSFAVATHWIAWLAGHGLQTRQET